jgi:argininosuccinate lyase
MTTLNEEKPWSGRFTQPTDAFVEQFSASVHFDKRLYACDIRGSIAHATMLAQVGVLTAEEHEKIVKGLENILIDIERGDFAWLRELEDVHMNIEARLTDRIGDVGKKLHTGRSRNDQVATDVRLYLRGEIDAIVEALERLIATLIDIAEREADTIMPGYTHMQPAQPVTFGHHLLAWVEMLLRDRARMFDARKRVNVMPLGSAALAGTSYPIDRRITAKLLEFEGISENSLDAVSDRDFAIEFTAACSLVMMHLSRFSEELVLWSSVQFGFVDIGDAFCTGSSIMPQKKNPDVPELVRGKTGRVYGNLTALLTLMKGQPLAYNRDNQEDKEPLFDTVDTVRDCLRAYADMMPHVSVRRDVMKKAAIAGYTTATDLADYLVRKGVPFRDAHAIVGQSVRHAIDVGRDLGELALEDLQRFSDRIDSDVFQVLSLEGSVSARSHIGGTAPAQVRAAVVRARERLAARV